MAPEHELSPRARQRMAALLPDLLGAMRARRRRRRVRRAAVALVAAALPLFAWQFATAPRRDPPGVVAAPSWRVVHDDPTVLARCAVGTHEREQWFVDDDGLQAALAAAERPAGLVRTRDRVLVSAVAIDPWPGPEGEADGDRP